MINHKYEFDLYIKFDLYTKLQNIKIVLKL